MAAVTSAVIGVATSTAAAVMSFNDAKREKDKASEANKAAAKAMAEARSRAEIDNYEGLTIPMDAYEAAFESSLAQQQTAVEALQEGDARGLAAGVGKVGALGVQRDEATRIAMGQEISDLERTKADSKDAINQQLLEMDVSAAKEQNQRKRDAEAAYEASISQGVTATGQALTSAAPTIDLYPKRGAGRKPKGTKVMVNSKGQQVSVMPGYDADGNKLFDSEFDWQNTSNPLGLTL